jgi:hypothetical protein
MADFFRVGGLFFARVPLLIHQQYVSIHAGERCAFTSGEHRIIQKIKRRILPLSKSQHSNVIVP